MFPFTKVSVIMLVTTTQDCHYCAWLCHLGWHDSNWIISIFVVLPKVAKANTIVTNTFIDIYGHWHFALKSLPMYSNLKFVSQGCFNIWCENKLECFHCRFAINFVM
jgi:hypothetical protein